MLKFLKLLLLVCLLLSPRPGLAQQAGQDPRVVAAKTACAAGDTQQAIRLLAELYSATNDPIWIFNQGRCYHQQNQFPKAVARFKEFLRKNVNGPAEDNRDAQSYISEIEAEMRKGDGKGEPKAEPSGALVAGPKPEPSSHDGRGLRYAGVALVAVGVASVATGVVFSLLTRKANSDVESKTSKPLTPYATVSDTWSSGKTYETLQWVGYGVGAGAVLTGGVLYYFGARQAAEPTSTTVVAPLVVSRGAGALLYHAF